MLIAVFGTLLVVYLGYIYCQWKYGYWQRRNVPFLPPKFPTGTSGNFLRPKDHLGYRLKRHYDKMKSNGWKHGGLYFMLKPNYVVIDLEYVKNVLSKDFQYFVDRGFYHNEKDDPLSAHLFALGGQKWRHLRAKLTPTFTSGKMKMMFGTLVGCVGSLLKEIEEQTTCIDIKEVLGCFTTNIIGSCAFGLECNTFEEKKSPFREYGKKAFVGNFTDRLKFIFAAMAPELAKACKVCLTSKEISNFFMKVVKDTVQYREKNNFKRNDFMQLLIDMKDSLTIEEIAAQCFVFFIAGFETSSTTMTFALYELARHQDIQDKVREEINTVLGKYNTLSYEAIQELKYMDQVINETLRMYPPVSFITRQCVKDYKVPNEDVVIEKGTAVMIPILPIHYDPEYYPDPEKFDPERFTEEEKSRRHHFAHIPFGEGPRLCIGLRFGLMQSKVGLASLLKKFRFRVNSKTQEPLHMKVNSFVLAAEGEIWLDAEKI